MIRLSSRLLAASRGSTAVEFALTVPLLIILLFGIIDGGRLIYTINRAEKATQMGVRYAAATDMVPAGLATYSFVIQGGIPQGQLIPESAFGGAICTETGCTCQPSATCPPLGTADLVAFNRIVTRMQAAMPEITASNLIVEYNYSGLGFAGDPNGSDVAPLVIVSLTGMQFQPTLTFGATISLPDFRAALTLEDGTGAISN